MLHRAAPGQDSCEWALSSERARRTGAFFMFSSFPPLLLRHSGLIIVHCQFRERSRGPKRNFQRSSQIKRRPQIPRASGRGDAAKVNGPRRGWTIHVIYLKLARSRSARPLHWVSRKSSSRIVLRCEGQPSERTRYLRATRPFVPPGQNGPYKPFIVIDRQIDNKGPAAGSGGHSPHPAAATATARVTRKRKV